MVDDFKGLLTQALRVLTAATTCLIFQFFNRRFVLVFNIFCQTAAALFFFKYFDPKFYSLGGSVVGGAVVGTGVVGGVVFRLLLGRVGHCRVGQGGVG